MNSLLEPILSNKRREVAALQQRLKQDAKHPIARVLHKELRLERPVKFKHVLRSQFLSVIAEIKRRSPSKGGIAAIPDPVKLAKRYIAGGASALSVLTDAEYFGGHIDDLAGIAAALPGQSIPIIRKDFIIDKVQIAEAAVAGASAILCIVSVLHEQTKALLAYARSIDMDALVEVHDRGELNMALDCGADIVGVNNRDLDSFELDTRRALDLVNEIPGSVIKVAESGITDPALARQYRQAGFDAVLIGETLSKSSDPERFIQECRNG
jgi:indole-3-glycerol phosphate synthase